MFTCPEDDIHSIYADGELPKNYVAEYEAHVNSCPKCSAKLKKFLALNSVFAEDKESFHFSRMILTQVFKGLKHGFLTKKLLRQEKIRLNFQSQAAA